MTLLFVLLACSAAGEDSGAGSTGSFPADSSAEGIAAFMEGEAWLQPPWVAESEAPRDEVSINSPHDRVQVFLNDVIQASAAEGRGSFGGQPHRTGSMSVKVIVDQDDDSALGHAVMLKLDGDFQEWVYWCEGPSSRCGAERDEEQTWGIGVDTTCGICHGGNVFNAQ